MSPKEASRSRAALTPALLPPRRSAISAALVRLVPWRCRNVRTSHSLSVEMPKFFKYSPTSKSADFFGATSIIIALIAIFRRRLPRFQTRADSRAHPKATFYWQRRERNVRDVYKSAQGCLSQRDSGILDKSLQRRSTNFLPPS